MNILNKILQKIGEFRKVFIERALIINYKKISNLPKIEAGYVDIDVVEKRYQNSLKSFSMGQLLKDLSVKDNFYFLEQECREYIGKFEKGTKLLDVGCGSGLYMEVFSRKGSSFENIEYIGTEIDKRFSDLSKKYLPSGNFITTYADNINIDDNSIDFVFSSSTLQYTLGKWKKSLDEIKRVSKRYIALTRFPVTKYNNTFFVHQTVRGLSGTENHYFIVINRSVLENYFKQLDLKILKRDYSSQEYSIDGIDEKIVLIQYLLEKNGN